MDMVGMFYFIVLMAKWFDWRPIKQRPRQYVAVALLTAAQQVRHARQTEFRSWH